MKHPLFARNVYNIFENYIVQLLYVKQSILLAIIFLNDYWYILAIQGYLSEGHKVPQFYHKHPASFQSGYCGRACGVIV